MKKIRKHSQILFLLGLIVFLVAGCKKNKPENEIVRLFTNEISQVTYNSAVVSGKVISNIPLDEVGVCYGINAMPTIENEKKAAFVENTLFSCELSNLQSDKTYYVRTYAVTTNGNVYYGNEESFNTVFANPPTVNLTADKTTITSGETVAFTIQADANAETMKNITTVRIDVVLNNENLYTDGSVVNAATYSKVVELKFEGYEGDAFEVSVTATDEAGEKATATVTVTIGYNCPVRFTYEISQVTNNSAVVSGNVTSNISLDEVGVCYGTNAMPTIENETEEVSVENSFFNCELSNLQSYKTYYIRAYAVATDGNIYYGEEDSFYTYNGPTTGTINGHTWVYLGLPSGTLWATTNVGADTPEAYGDYFAWGEIQPQASNEYSWSSYKYANCTSGSPRLTRYCNSLGYNGFADTLTVLLPEDDAATANWGNVWRMPTADEIRELCDNCTHNWTTRNEVYGILFTALNGNSIFLPAAGSRNDGELYLAGICGRYWSSSLYTDVPFIAWHLDFSSDGYGMESIFDRVCGLSVRPVCSVSQK